LINKAVALSLIFTILAINFIGVDTVEAAGNTKMGVYSSTYDRSIEDTFSIIIWLDGDVDESIDSFKINLLEWNASVMHANSVSDGWWDWLWDAGDINNTAGEITDVQAGEQSGTTTNQTACTISFTTVGVGTTYVNLSDVQAGAGGPTVDVTTFNKTLTIHPDRGAFSAAAYSPYQINLTFSLGVGSDYTAIRGSQSGYPSTPQDGSEIYNGSGTTYAHSGLNAGETWYYRAWAYNSTHGLFSIDYRFQTATTPITRMGISPGLGATISQTYSVTLWLDGAEEIDAFKIEELLFNNSKINVTGVQAGWWDWLWDPGTINNTAGNITDIQAGSQTGTMDNHTACIINFTVYEVGYSYLDFGDVNVGSGGPIVDSITYNNTVSLHPANCTIDVDTVNESTINLTFAAGEGADEIVIRGSTSDYPSTPTSGISVYSGSGVECSHEDLNPLEKWYYSAWSHNTTEDLYSLSPLELNETTLSGNIAPEIGTPTPSNSSIYQSPEFIWLVYISDSDGDLMNWSIECSNGNTTNGTGASNGTKYIIISGLSFATEYRVWVNVSDAENITSEWFNFTTMSNVSGGAGVDVIKLLITNDATDQNDDLNFLISVANPSTELPQTGKANDILFYASYVNGTIIVNGEHPDELGYGLYTYSFPLDDIGDYIAWATVDFGGQSYMDAKIFRVKWDIYNNFSRLSENIGDIIYMLNWNEQNSTRMITYRITAQDLKLDDLKISLEEKTMVDRLTDAATQSLFETIISICILIVLLTIGGLVYGQRRTRRIMRVVQTPQSLAENLVYGSEPVYTEGRGKNYPEGTRPIRKKSTA